MSKKFSVTIHWGSEATREENPDAAVGYEFDTQAELNAFLYGVDEASGWMDYDIVEDEKGDPLA